MKRRRLQEKSFGTGSGEVFRRIIPRYMRKALAILSQFGYNLKDKVGSGDMPSTKLGEKPHEGNTQLLRKAERYAADDLHSGRRGHPSRCDRDLCSDQPHPYHKRIPHRQVHRAAVAADAGHGHPQSAHNELSARPRFAVGLCRAGHRVPAGAAASAGTARRPQRAGAYQQAERQQRPDRGMCPSGRRCLQNDVRRARRRSDRV